MNHQKSFAWKHFTKIQNDKANCNICKKKVVCKGGTTSTLLSHLKSQHNLNRKLNENEGTADVGLKAGPSKKICLQSNMLQFVRRPSLEEIVSRLAALDGLSIRQISRSIFIRESINARGYEFPKSENTVMKLILNFATKIENELKEKIKSKQFNKLSLTFDEWTSLRARRYLNLNLYNSDLESINLGLILIHGSCDSYKTRELIHQQLNKFGLILKNDIVATTCDGASVNVKFGKESEAEIILCMNHGLHLGVTDILYKKSSRLVEATIETNEFSESDCDIQYDDELKNEEYYEIEYSDISFEVCINSVRNVTQFFKRSPVRNAILQQYVTQTFNVQIGLILDCKTRWNTLLLMIQRFLKPIDCIKKALDDLQKLNMLKEKTLQ